jgi:hypothetical protein
VSHINSCLAYVSVLYKPISDNFIVDTGSANTWLGANQPYHETDSTRKTYDLLVRIIISRFLFLAQLELKFVNQSVNYGSGFVRG